MAAVTIIKTSLGDDFRRFKVPPYQHEGDLQPLHTLAGLRERVQSLYAAQLPLSTIWRLYYVDADGDLITVAEDADVALAYEAAVEACQTVLRLYVCADRPSQKRQRQRGMGEDGVAGDPCGSFLRHLMGQFAPAEMCGRKRGGCCQPQASPANDGATAGKAASATTKPATPPTSPKGSGGESDGVASAHDYVHVSSPSEERPGSGPSIYPGEEQQPEQPQPQQQQQRQQQQTAPSPSASAARWVRELSILKEMGLTVDEERLSASLDRHQGIIQGVLGEVFSRMQK